MCDIVMLIHNVTLDPYCYDELDGERGGLFCIYCLCTRCGVVINVKFKNLLALF